jgi:hypothetical protein
MCRQICSQMYENFNSDFCLVAFIPLHASCVFFYFTVRKNGNFLLLLACLIISPHIWKIKYHTETIVLDIDR